MNQDIIPRFLRDRETWPELIRRVGSVGRSSDASEYRELLATGKLVPGGQILRGSGDAKAVLYNCFVTGIHDGEDAGQLASRITEWTELGAGVGVNIDPLTSSTGSPKYSANDVISGIADSQQKLWERGVRRTATMITLSLSDENVVAAAKLLASNSKYRHLNLGVLVTDVEMESLSSGFRSRQSETIHELAQTAWETGNPGLIFIDRVQRDHNFAEQIRACNPCAEQFLAEEEGCNLASLNLAEFITSRGVNWLEFDQAVFVAIRFLDDIIDATAFPSVQTELMAKRRRRVGLGVMGFASALARLGIKYGSDESVALAHEWSLRLRHSAIAASESLAAIRGPFLDSQDGKRRNSHLLSIAPTGAISLIWRVSSGIEPFFGQQIQKEGLSVNFGNEGGQPVLTAHEISPAAHVAVAAAWQANVDGGISKTVNLQSWVGIEAVQEVFVNAWASGCKGVTVFRDQSRVGGVVPIMSCAA